MLFLLLNGTPPLTCLFYLVVLIFSATIHEIAHAWTAFKLGDPTAKMMGRITLNPKVHLTKGGTIAMLLLPIGWANPVMINPRNFKKPRRDSVLVSIAGPLSNFLLLFVSLFFAVILLKFPISNSAFSLAVNQALNMFIFLNSLLMIFNLLPIPPLDGSRLLTTWLPYKAREFLYQIERYGIIVLFLLIQILWPLISWLQSLVIGGILRFLQIIIP